MRNEGEARQSSGGEWARSGESSAAPIITPKAKATAIAASHAPKTDNPKAKPTRPVRIMEGNGATRSNRARTLRLRGRSSGSFESPDDPAALGSYGSYGSYGSISQCLHRTDQMTPVRTTPVSVAVTSPRAIVALSPCRCPPFVWGPRSGWARASAECPVGYTRTGAHGHLILDTLTDAIRAVSEVSLSRRRSDGASLAGVPQ